MSKTRVVNQGEHMSRIAAEEGFANFHTIFDRPENADLKRTRDPHILFPGDRVFVPDRADKDVARPTDDTHKFETEVPPLFLRCKLLDWQRDPIKSAPCDVQVDGETLPKTTTNGAGILEQRIGRLAKAAVVNAELPPFKVARPGEPPEQRPAIFQVKIGSLNPETKISGQQARLQNLGYDAGFDVRELDQLHWAAEEFLCDDTDGQPVTKRPAIKPAPPQGEDDPAKNDAAGATGLQDGALIARLVKAHGL